MAGARSRLSEPRAWPEHPQGFQSRIAFAAAHVVADPRGENVPGAPAAIDWEATLAFRRHLFRAAGSVLPRPWTLRNAIWVWTGLPPRS